MQLKQKTVAGTTVKLYRTDGKVSNRQYDYRVEADGEQIGPIHGSKQRAMDLFQRVVGNLQTNGQPRTQTMDETAGASTYQRGHTTAYGGGTRRGGFNLEDGL